MLTSGAFGQSQKDDPAKKDNQEKNNDPKNME